MKYLKNYLLKVVLMVSVAGLFGCGGGGSDHDDGGTPPPVPKTYSLNQAAFNGSSYKYGFNSINNIKIAGAPADADYSRWAMLHDGGAYRLYLFKKGTNSRIYQFVFNSATSKYEYGFAGAIPEIAVTGAPADADPSSFAMLHDGVTYRLYMSGKSNPASVHQFGFNPTTQRYEYGHNSIPKINITGAPADADLKRWAMLHDGTTYRLYIFKTGSKTTFYQFAYNGSSYAFGHNSIPTLTVTSMPASSDTSSFAMLHDALSYRFYFMQSD